MTDAENYRVVEKRMRGKTCFYVYHKGQVFDCWVMFDVCYSEAQVSEAIIQHQLGKHPTQEESLIVIQ